MKLLIYSDLHIEFSSFDVPPEALAEADAIVLAGDIDVGERGVLWARKWARNVGKPVIYVPGNHEFYGYRLAHLDRADWIDEMRDFGAEARVHVLDREALVMGDVRVLGTTLWTDFQLHAQGPHDRSSIDQAMADGALGLYDFTAISEDGRQFMPEDAAREHALSRAWLLDQLAQPWAGKTVVVTHHAPSFRSSDPAWKGHPLCPCFSSELPPDFFAGVDLWIHGHMHTPSDYLHHHGCRVVCNPRGFPTSTLPLRRDQYERPDQPDLIVEV